MKHSFPHLFPIKGGIKHEATNRAMLTAMPFCPDKTHTADDRRTVTSDRDSALTGIEAVLTALLILQIIRSPHRQECQLVGSSDKLFEKKPHLKNNRYYKAWRRKELLKNNRVLTS